MSGFRIDSDWMNETQARLQLAGVNLCSLLRQHTKALDHATEVGGKAFSHNLVRARRVRQRKKIAAGKARYWRIRERIESELRAMGVNPAIALCIVIRKGK